jgi:2-alkenal reductase
MKSSKVTLWLGGFLIIVISLLAGTLMGGTAGYIVAREQLSAAESVALNSPNLMPPVVEAAPVFNSPAAPNSQSLVVSEESAIVDAVQKVLPAVVTVISGGSQGTGSGSGFFINDEGYLVTNNHVVENATRWVVIYSQGGTAPAELVGTAPEFDLAVLKVEGKIPALTTWGDSGELPLGSHVVAIGSALGRYQNTVTAGVLSGFNRELGPLRGLLQTDAAINQGNSGGPLINLAGQVIGINTLVVRGSGFQNAEGLGFAIPSNVAMKVVEQLIDTGEVKPSFLGIQYQELNPQLANEAGLTITYGALLQEIVAGTPADQAQLRRGDVIVAINGQMIDDRHPLVSELLEYVAGETVTLDILRDGQTFQTTLTLSERA